MSSAEPPNDGWDPNGTGDVPVGPEPEATGAGGAGSDGWGGAPRLEPLAIAAFVWAIVSIVIPVVGTIIAFVLAARAADVIRRSRGERTGTQYVLAARIVAAAVIVIWAIGLVAYFALRDDSGTNANVVTPTQPPVTTVTPTSSTAPATTSTTHPVVTTSPPKPTITVVPPPTSPPTTATPTLPPTSAPPTTAPPTTAPPTTAPPTSTTTPDQGKAAAVQRKLLARPQLGPSNRGVPDDERFVVSYTPGQDLLVTWAVDNGTTRPTGTPDCAGPPTTTAPTSSTSSTTTTATSTTTTSTTVAPTSTSSAPGGRTTPLEARYEARQILLSIRSQLTSLHLDVPGVQLVGRYPIDASGDSDVVQVRYSKATVQSGFSDYKKAFDVPPADVVQCLNPAFDL